MDNLDNHFETVEESIQNSPFAPNLVVIGSEMTKIPPSPFVCKLFDHMWKRVK